MGTHIVPSLSAAGRLSRDLIAYFALTFLFSWVLQIPLSLQALGLMPAVLPKWLHYLAAFGPLLAASLVTLATRGVPGLGRLFAGLLRWRARGVYWLSAVGAPCVLFGLIVLITRLVQGTWPDLTLLGRPDYLPTIGILPTLLLWIATFGVGEEVGRRGFALPRLQQTRSAFSSSMILGFF